MARPYARADISVVDNELKIIDNDFMTYETEAHSRVKIFEKYKLNTHYNNDWMLFFVTLQTIPYIVIYACMGRRRTFEILFDRWYNLRTDDYANGYSMANTQVTAHCDNKLI